MADSERNGENAAPRPATWTWPPSRRALTLLAALRWPSPRVLSTLGPLRAGKSRLGFEGTWGLRAVLRCCPRRAPCSGRRVRARAPASRRGLRPLPVRARRARGSSRGRPAPPRSSPRKQRPDSAGRAAGSPRADAAVPHVLGFFTPNPLPSPRDRPLLALNGVGSFVSGGSLADVCAQAQRLAGQHVVVNLNSVCAAHKLDAFPAQPGSRHAPSRDREAGAVLSASGSRRRGRSHPRSEPPRPTHRSHSARSAPSPVHCRGRRLRPAPPARPRAALAVRA